LIRPFATIAKEDVESEIETITKLCCQGHRNVVEVISHRALTSSPYYAIDMEFCDLTLGDFIGGERDLVQKAWNEKLDYYQRASEAAQKWIGICLILVDINEGLSFIHDCKFVHRDLKPSNGTSPP